MRLLQLLFSLSSRAVSDGNGREMMEDREGKLGERIKNCGEVGTYR